MNISYPLTPHVLFAYASRPLQAPRKKPLQSGPGWRACFQLFRVLDGTLVLPEAQFTARPDDVLLLDPGIKVEENEASKYWRIVFDLVHKPEHRTKSKAWKPQPSWLKLFGQTCPQVMGPDFWKRRISVLHHIVTTRFSDPVSALRANALLSTLVCDLLDETSTRYKRKEPIPHNHLWVLRSLEDLLMRGLASGLSISEAANQLGYHPVYLSRMYRQSRGFSIKDFIRTTRIRKSCDVMQANKDLSIAEVASLVGLRTPGALYRAFIKELGIGPDAWRRRQL